MKLRKLNKSPWLTLGLAAMLLVGCLVMATGPALARYRVDERATVNLIARPLEQIYLGKMVRSSDDEETKVFDHERQGTWQLVDGTTRLEFAVANGKIVNETDAQTGTVTTTEVFAEEDQRVLVQLVGGLSVWNGEDEFILKLIAPSRTELGESEEFEASAERIDPDSLLYKTFGDGWIFTFLDEDGKELSLPLEGGKLAALDLVLVLEGEVPEHASLLKLQVTGDYTKK